MKTKICKCCGRELPISEFKRDTRYKLSERYNDECNECRIKKRNAAVRAHNASIPAEVRKAKKHEIYMRRRDKQADYQKANKEHIKERMVKWREDNKEARREYARNYEKTARIKNPNRRLAKNLRTRVGMAIKGLTKSAATFDLIGCDVDFLRKYLEERFEVNMSWDNYGRGKKKWGLDHIIPCKSFDLSIPENQRACFHYSNLQPMWNPENTAKSDNLNWKKKKDYN